MAATKITYDDKVSINPQTTHINQVWDEDMNEIKDAINTNADLFDTLEGEVDVNTLDIEELQNAAMEIDNVINVTTSDTLKVYEFALVDASSGDVTITLQTAIGVSGKPINVKKVSRDNSIITIQGTASQTMDGFTKIEITQQYDCLTFVSDGANWQIK